MLGLSLPYRKYLGAQTGCGCGFADDDDADRQPVLEAFREYLTFATTFGDVELAMLWEGQGIDENTRPLRLKLSDFTGNVFPLADGFTSGPVLAIVQS